MPVSRLRLPRSSWRTSAQQIRARFPEATFDVSIHPTQRGAISWCACPTFRSGNSSDTQDFGEVIQRHLDQLHVTYGPTYLVADSALYSAANLQKLAQTHMEWIT